MPGLPIIRMTSLADAGRTGLRWVEGAPSPPTTTSCDQTVAFPAARSCLQGIQAELAPGDRVSMAMERRPASWSVNIRRLLVERGSARRANSTKRRGWRGVAYAVAIDHLEKRTLLSVSALIGPIPSSTGLSEQTTFNLQLREGSALALEQLMPLISSAGATVTPTSVSGLYTVQGPAENIGQLTADFSTNPAVEYSQPVQTFQIQTVPNDPYYQNGKQWQLTGTWGVNPLPAWNVTTGSDQVIVADVDTGLNYNDLDIYDNVWLNQPEIPTSVFGNLTDVYNDGAVTFTDLNNLVNQGPGLIEDTNGDGIITGADVLASTSVGGWVNSATPNTQDGDTADPNDYIGWNYVNDTDDPMDDEGHGSFTAGEIGEMTNNSLGGAGLVWNTQIMPVVFLDSSGSGSDTAAAEAIDYAVNHGAKVINASWGGTGTDTTIASAIQYADQHNVIIVAAAGNNTADDDTTFFSPASYSAQYPNVVAVAATDDTGALASFSNYGTGTVQLAAPGVNVYSMTSTGSYGYDSGTSMAAPLVTGTIALVEAAHPSWTMSQVIDAVLDTVTPDPALAGKVSTGGIVNAGAAVANTDGPYALPSTPGGSVTSSPGFSSVQVSFNEEINPATFTAAQVTLSGPGGVIPSGEVTVTPVSGSNDHEFQISFPGQTIAGTYTLKVGPSVQDWYGNDMNQNRNGVNGEAADAFSEAIQVKPAAAQTFTVTGFPTSPTAGTAYSVTVTAYDAYHNVATGYTGAVALSSSDGHAVLPGSYSFTGGDAGSHTFSIILETAGTQSITATDTITSSITGSESGIVVQAAATKTLAVIGFPNSSTAGTAYNVTVTAYDAYHNVATAYTGTVGFSSSDGQAVLPGNYAFTGADAGAHTFSLTLETAGTQSITATDTITSSLTGSESNIVVQAAAAKTLAVTGFPTGPMAVTKKNVTVTAYDAYNNVATGYTGTVALSSGDGHAGLPANYPFTGADAGSHVFSVTLKTAGTQSITATDTTSSSITGSESGIVVKAAAAKTLAVTGFPTSPTAGTAYNVTVTAYDAYNNVATGYTGTVAFSSSDGHAGLPANYAFKGADAGVHIFSVTLKTAGSQSITATDTITSSITGSESNIVVLAAAAKTLAVTGFPTSPTAGAAYNVTVTAYDAYNNVATGYTGTVALSSSDAHAGLPANYPFTGADAGSHIFSVTLKTAGPQSITATDTTTSGLVASQTGISVQAAAAQSFTVSGFPTTVTAGTASQIVVTAYDAFGNVATGYTGTVALSSNDSQAVLPNNYAFTEADAGTHRFSVTLITAGTQSITATDRVAKTLTASEVGITVQAAAAKTLEVAGFPTSETAGANDLVTVTARDAFGNVANGYLGTVSFSSSDGRAVLPANYTFTEADAGTHRFSVTLVTAGTQSITAADTTTSSITGTESSIVVQAAAAKTLAVTGFPTSPTAGTAYSVTVTAYDAYSNVATGYTGTVALSSSDGNAGLPADYTFTGADAGSHIFSVTLKTAGSQSITATDTMVPSVAASEDVIMVQAASATTLAVTDFPMNPTAGTASAVTVTAYDAYGNVADGYRGTVALTSSASDALLVNDYTFTALDAGVHGFSVALDIAGTQSITATDVSSTSVSGGEPGITISAAAAESFKVTGFPTKVTAGTASSVTVTAYDAYGNVATGYTGSVAIASSDGHAVLPDELDFSSQSAGTQSGSVTLVTAGTQSITARDVINSALSGTEPGIIVNPAAASVLVVSGYPSTTAGVAQNFTVSARDPYGNTATGYTGTLSFQSSDPQASALAGLHSDYTFTTGPGDDNGVHTFSATLKTAGTQSISARDTVSGSIFGTEAGIAVSTAEASLLVFGRQPTGTTAGASVNPAVTVLIEDAYGNLISSNSSVVALTLQGGSFEGGSNTTTASASGGVATFSGIKIDVAGSYSVSAADGSLSPSGPSESFTISPAAGARLVIHTQPSPEATAGQAFGIQPVVYEVDRFGDVETGDESTVVTASLHGGTGPLEGMKTATVKGGVASFGDLGDDTAETIELAINGGSLAQAISGPITVAPAAPSQLVVTTPPPNPIVAGQAFSLAVSVEDTYGNVETAYSNNVTISIPNDPGFSATVQARNGVAEFVGLTLSTGAGRIDPGDRRQLECGGDRSVERDRGRGASDNPQRTGRDAAEEEQEGQAARQAGDDRLRSCVQHGDEASVDGSGQQLSDGYDQQETREEEERERSQTGRLHVGVQRRDRHGHALDQREAEFRQGGRDPGDGIGPRWCRERSRIAARFERHELQHPSQGEGDRTDPLKEFGQRKARDSNPHFPKENRVSSAARPTVSGYLPFL